MVLGALEALLVAFPLDRRVLVRTGEVEGVDLSFAARDDHALILVDRRAVGGGNRKLLLVRGASNAADHRKREYILRSGSHGSGASAQNRDGPQEISAPDQRTLVA